MRTITPRIRTTRDATALEKKQMLFKGARHDEHDDYEPEAEDLIEAENKVDYSTQYTKDDLDKPGPIPREVLVEVCERAKQLGVSFVVEFFPRWSYDIGWLLALGRQVQ